MNIKFGKLLYAKLLFLIMLFWMNGSYAAQCPITQPPLEEKIKKLVEMSKNSKGVFIGKVKDFKTIEETKPYPRHKKYHVITFEVTENIVDGKFSSEEGEEIILSTVSLGGIDKSAYRAGQKFVVYTEDISKWGGIGDINHSPIFGVVSCDFESGTKMLNSSYNQLKILRKISLD